MFVFILGLAVYWPSLHGGFIWDDDSMLTANPFVQARNGLGLIWFSTGPIDYFPLTYTSLWAEWHLWGMNSLGYHVTNILLHAAGCLLLWRVLANLKIPGAFLASLLFLVHPVNVESVAWIAERKNALSLVFYFLTVLLFVKFDNAGKKHFYFWSLAAFLLSLLSKTSGVMLPFVLLGLAWWQRRKITKTDLLRSLPFFGLALVLGFVTIWFQYNRAIADDVIHHRDFWMRLAGAGWAVWFYLGKALWPADLSFVYREWNIDPHSLLSYLPGFAVFGVLILFWRFRHSWGRPLLFVFAYFMVTLFPVLGFFKVYFQRYSYVADHWQYFSLPALVVLIAAAVNLLPALAARRLVAGVLVIVLAALTWRQAAVYKSEESVWRDTMAKNPQCWLAYNEFGMLLERNGQHDEAIKSYQRSFEIKRDQVEARNNLGALYYNQGKYDQAMELFQAARKLNARTAATHLNIGNVLNQRGQRTEAIAEFREAVRLNPAYPEAHNNLACLLLAEGKAGESVAQFQEALKWRPNYLDALCNLGGALTEQGNIKDAIACAAAAVEQRPNHAHSRFVLGNAWFAAGKFSEAIDQYNAALQLQPDLIGARFKTGMAFLRLQKIDEAVNQFSMVLAQDPNLVEAHYQMAVAFGMKKNKAQAQAHLREVIRLNPNVLEALNQLAWLLATDAKSTFRDGVDAVRFARRAAEITQNKDAAILDTLAAACAQTEQFADAMKFSEQALELARTAGQTNLAAQIHRRQELYRHKVPFYEP